MNKFVAYVTRRPLPLPVVATLMAGLMVFIVWFGIVCFTPPKRTRSPEEIATDKWILKLSQESGGDINKLKPADRERLQKMTMGHGQLALKYVHTKFE